PPLHSPISLHDALPISRRPSELIRVPAPRVTTQAKDAPMPCFKAEITQATSPYLLQRGITAEVQAEYRVGYNEKHIGFTAIPFRSEEHTSELQSRFDIV